MTPSRFTSRPWPCVYPQFGPVRLPSPAMVGRAREEDGSSHATTGSTDYDTPKRFAIFGLHRSHEPAAQRRQRLRNCATAIDKIGAIPQFLGNQQPLRKRQVFPRFAQAREHADKLVDILLALP